jgi:hypothetical protein
VSRRKHDQPRETRADIAWLAQPQVLTGRSRIKVVGYDLTQPIPDWIAAAVADQADDDHAL